MTARVALPDLLARGAVTAPGVYDALSARIAETEAFPAVYLGGAGATAAQLAAPDAGYFTIAELATQTRRIAAAVEIPLIVDADSGYGAPAQVVKAVEGAGAAALHLEDRSAPKGAAGRLLEPDEFIRSLGEALSARSDPRFLVIARTVVLPTLGIAEAIARANAYLEAGADALFVEGFSTRDEVSTVAEKLHGATLVYLLSSRAGKPEFTLDELEDLGFAMILVPSLALLTATAAVSNGLRELREGRGLRTGVTPALTREDLDLLLDSRRDTPSTSRRTA